MRPYPSHARHEFKRKVLRAALRWTQPPGCGVRMPERGEVPLSQDEIFHGVLHGIIRIPPLERHQPREETRP